MKKLLGIALLFGCLQGFGQEAKNIAAQQARKFLVSRMDTAYLNFIAGDTTPLVIVGKARVTDTVEFDTRVSYHSNLGASFTPFSHVDKNYTDSAILAHASASPVVFSQTANGAALTTSTTLTSMLGTGTGSLTIAANSLQVGQTITIHGFFMMSTAASPGSLSFNPIIGGTGSSFAPTIPISVTSDPVEYTAYITILTTGSSGTATVTQTVLINNQFPQLSLLGAGTTITVNTTTSNALTMDAQWGSSVSGNSLQSMPSFTVKVQ